MAKITQRISPFLWFDHRAERLPQMKALLAAGLLLAACRAPQPRTTRAPAAAARAPVIVTIAAPDGAHAAQGALVTKKLTFSGVPRIFVAMKRSALEAMPGDVAIMSGGGLSRYKEVLRDDDGPRWRALKDKDAALLPVGLYVPDMDKPVALESLSPLTPGLAAPPAELIELADQVPLK